MASADLGCCSAPLKCLEDMPVDKGCHLYNPKVLFASALFSDSPLVASHYGSSGQSRTALHRTSVLANSLLILLHGPISTCVWFGTTVSVTLCLSLRGQGEAIATLLSDRKYTHTHAYTQTYTMSVRDGKRCRRKV